MVGSGRGVASRLTPRPNRSNSVGIARFRSHTVDRKPPTRTSRDWLAMYPVSTEAPAILRVSETVSCKTRGLLKLGSTYEIAGGPSRVARGEPGAMVKGRTFGNVTPSRDGGANRVVFVVPLPRNGI